MSLNNRGIVRASMLFAFPVFFMFYVAGCADNSAAVNDPDLSTDCIIPTSQFADGGVGKDGIPALTDPELISPAEVDYLDPTSRVIGFEIDGQAVAVPHNILWYHEISNFNFDQKRFAVSYCPLTGTSMAFDRSAIGGAEFGVSGLLFQNNLTMYDRTSGESLWPQMLRKAGCGPSTGTKLEMVPTFEMGWTGWLDLHPDTRVLSTNTGFRRDYTRLGYPYGDYERETNARLLFSQDIDGRRPPKERLLGIPGDDGGIAFPFNELNKAAVTVIHESVDGGAVVVFWSRLHEGAMAYRPRLAGMNLTFREKDGLIRDSETDSIWRVDGLAIDGPMSGNRLEPIAEAFVAFWFAWAAFEPDTRIWEAG